MEMSIELLKRRREGFEAFYKQLMPVLCDFVQRLGHPQSHNVLKRASDFVPLISEFMEHQAISAEDRNWIESRLGYFIGEVFVQRYGGCWYVDEVAESPHYCRYVVGRFALLPESRAALDPFAVAHEFTNTPVGRDLARMIDSLDDELQGSVGNTSCN